MINFYVVLKLIMTKRLNILDVVKKSHVPTLFNGYDNSINHELYHFIDFISTVGIT